MKLLSEQRLCLALHTLWHTSIFLFRNTKFQFDCLTIKCVCVGGGGGGGESEGMFLQRNIFRFWLPEVPCPCFLSLPFFSPEDNFVNINFHIVMIVE